jgi:AcrR family transcriptional regulator
VLQAPLAGAGTCDRLLDAAERLFAAHGFRGVSLRELTAAAGVNLAAVSYHFGSKKELLRAVLERRVAPVNAERLRRLDALEARARGRPLPLDELVAAFLAPAFEAARQPRFQDVAALLHSEPVETVRPLLDPLFGECARRFLASVGAALAEADDATVSLRFHVVVGAMAHFLAGRHLEGPAARSRMQGVGDGEVLRELVGFCAAGLGAPVSRARARRRRPAAHRARTERAGIRA